MVMHTVISTSFECNCHTSVCICVHKLGNRSRETVVWWIEQLRCSRYLFATAFLQSILTSHDTLRCMMKTSTFSNDRPPTVYFLPRPSYSLFTSALSIISVAWHGWLKNERTAMFYAYNFQPFPGLRKPPNNRVGNSPSTSFLRLSSSPLLPFPFLLSIPPRIIL